MIVERTMHPGWQSNTWLVADRAGGKAVLVDTGGPMAPILRRIEELRLEPTHVLCTHHHYDHVAHNEDYARRFSCPVCAHPREEALFDTAPDVLLEDGQELEVGELRVRALHIPGHTVGQLAFVVNDERVFTGDTLFAGSVGGNRGPGHGSFDELRGSIMDVLMRLPPATVVHPGHQGDTTIGREWEENPFVRLWRGLDPPRREACEALGRPAELLLSARDYDGGRKCLVRFDDGSSAVVAGSRVRSGG